MLQQKINYKGIARAVGNQMIQDGYLDELINLRHRQGKLQPVGNPTKLYNLPDVADEITYLQIYKHEQDNIDNFIGLTDSYELRLIDMALGKSTPIKQYSGLVQVVFLKRFMIVIHDDGMDRFLFKDDQYSLINYPGKPSLSVYKKNKMQYVTDEAITAQAILGKYYAKVNELSRDEGKLTGAIMYRAAFRMFDGSYVLHTIPTYEELGLKMELTEQSVEGSGQENDLRTVKLWASNLEVKLCKSAYDTIDTDIFTHVVIFACRNESLYEFNEETFDQDFLIDWAEEMKANTVDDFKNIFDSVNSDFKKMADSSSWYKIHEIDIKEIQDSENIDFVEDIDMTDFYQDYATRETLTVDQFSHHSLLAAYAMNYNSRLIISDVSTIFGDYTANYGFYGLTYPIMRGYVHDSSRHTYLLWTLKTSQGEIKQLSTLGNLGFSVKRGESATKKFAMLPPVLGYPDSRATKLEILTDDGSGQYYNIASFNLKKSKYGNFALYFSDLFEVNSTPNADSGINYGWLYINSEFTAAEQIKIDLYLNPVAISDSNRIQISETSNPFYFPAENSYQIGTGKIIACATNTEPLSSGQYGEHPLIVFTTKGIWTLFQGHGDVLFSAVKPLDGEVAISRDQIISTGTGVTYSTERGLYFIQGMRVTELTELLTGMPNTEIQEVDNYLLRVNHLNLVQLVNSLSKIDAKNYILSTKIGFDKKNNELLVTNNNYGYSYVYSFESGFWSKKSESFRILINAYPELLCLRENSNNDGVFSISQEDFTNTIATMLTTRPCKIDNEANFILLHRAIQRCEIETKTSTYSGFYVFGSNDLHTWQLLQGNDKKTGKVIDIFLTRSHGKCKYYIFVYAADIKEYSAINDVDLQYYYKLQNKIR